MPRLLRLESIQESEQPDRRPSRRDWGSPSSPQTGGLTVRSICVGADPPVSERPSENRCGSGSRSRRSLVETETVWGRGCLGACVPGPGRRSNRSAPPHAPGDGLLRRRDRTQDCGDVAAPDAPFDLRIEQADIDCTADVVMEDHSAAVLPDEQFPRAGKTGQETKKADTDAPSEVVSDRPFSLGPRGLTPCVPPSTRNQFAGARPSRRPRERCPRRDAFPDE